MGCKCRLLQEAGCCWPNLNAAVVIGSCAVAIHLCIVIFGVTDGFLEVFGCHAYSRDWGCISNLVSGLILVPAGASSLIGSICLTIGGRQRKKWLLIISTIFNGLACISYLASIIFLCMRSTIFSLTQAGFLVPFLIVSKGINLWEIVIATGANLHIDSGI